MALEFLDAWVGWQLPLVEVAVCSNDEIEVKIVSSRLCNIRDVQAPLGLSRVPLRRVDFCLKATFRVNIELLGNGLPVVLNLLALSIFLGPVDFGRVSRLVAVRWDVTPDTWVDVLEPSTSLV